MEQSESYKKAEATIKALEGRLAVCSNFNKECDESARETEKEIEEYFAKILNSLAARKATLLANVQQQLSHKKDKVEETQSNLKSSIETFKQTMKAASMFYAINPGTAESMFKGITEAPVPEVFDARITVELPDSIFETIQVLGQVDIPNNFSASSRFTVPETVSTLAGSTQGNADGSGSKAQFNYPWTICLLDDCLYVCDHRGNSIRKVTLQGDVSTLLGHSSLEGASAIVGFHNMKLFFVASDTSHSIYKVSSGAVSLFAGSGQNGRSGYTDGAGANARFNYPRGIAVDQQTGTIYVSEYSNCAIRKIIPQGVVSTLAGAQGEGFADGTGPAAKFYNPWGMCFDETSRSLLVCDYSNNKIRRVQLNGEVTTLCQVLYPIGIAQAANGTIFVAANNHKILKVIRTGQHYKAIEVAGSGHAGRIDGKPSESAFQNPYGIVIHEASHSCYIADASSQAVRKISFAATV